MAGCAAPLAGSAGNPTPTGETVITSTPFPTLTLTPTSTPVAETATPQETPASGANPVLASCALTPMRVPTEAKYPGYTELDESTNLHVTGNAVKVDLANYRLKVTGLVETPLSLSLDDLRCMPKVTATPTLICPGYFADKATWSGVPIKYILELAGVKGEAKRISMVSADSYQTRVDIQAALEEGNFLAYEWEGQPLPILHGFPLRAVFPALEGNKWAKWLVEIRVE
jgi:DMSO/TMAO reductase YedYZ molybdopterin-dependent catalytic subunit